MGGDRRLTAVVTQRAPAAQPQISDLTRPLVDVHKNEELCLWACPSRVVFAWFAAGAR